MSATATYLFSFASIEHDILMASRDTVDELMSGFAV